MSATDSFKERINQWLKWEFRTPEKHIDDLFADLGQFASSPGGKDILGFILALNSSVQGITITEGLQADESVFTKELCSVLVEFKRWIAEIPPQVQEQRFGNKSFRTWIDRVAQNIERCLENILLADIHAADVKEECRGKIPRGLVNELVPYILASFGDRVRIDYGTGHELNFIALLCCLSKIGLFGKARYSELVFRVFTCYLDLMRELQMVYWLEPAGSRGVWGLDDYQFLPFMWGAAQLIDNGGLDPDCIHNDETVAKFSKDYLYLDMIRMVKKMKTGPFHEYAPLLNDISGVPNWNKVNSG
jgi:serine/threonine-protein phosphatase 2A activator